MVTSRRILALALALAVAVACGTTEDSEFSDGSGLDEDASAAAPAPGFVGTNPTGGGDGGGRAQLLTLEPRDVVMVVESGKAVPQTSYVAKMNGQSVKADFTLDRGEIALIGAKTGALVPTGNVAGKIVVSATYAGRIATTSATVQIKTVENGSTAGGDAGGGAGGFGGVGGEGIGAAVDAGVLAALKTTPVAAPNLRWLYPYDNTVWPRGILAPLLQWSPGDLLDYDAVQIHVKETNYEYVGTFAKTKAPFDHHPIPQPVWKALGLSNRGEDVTVTLTFAKAGKAYGPIQEKWKIASGSLKGTVYYNSYGTRLAKNYGGAKGGDGRFGGATLAIKGSSTDPVLVAGKDGGTADCRVCHSVSANGAKLITQRGLGGQRKYSAYDLASGDETALSPEGDANNAYPWPALYPDGSMFLSDSSPMDGSTSAVNRLFSTPSGAGPLAPVEVAATDWPSGLRAAMPVFSPDGKQVAFNAYSQDAVSLATIPFDPTTKKFGALQTIHTPVAGAAGWPSFLPAGTGVVFQREIRYNTRDFGGTRSDADVAPPDPRATRGTTAELWWVDLKTKQAHRLDNLNGVGALPTGASVSYLGAAPNGAVQGAGHDDDAALNYEPTVNPVPSGGYAWVVFTSRRLYGNVATVDPYASDPRYHDLTATPTPKKLWVAAVDLNAAPGKDPSHPAFYLPAQELLAGNSRGYWVVDPCKPNTQSCETGDECCGGYCRPQPGGGLACQDKPPTCAQEFEKCTVDADCCGGGKSLLCVGGRCVQPAPTGPR